MADEITMNYVSGLSLYFCCFQPNGDVFLTGGASDEVWGTGARDAAAYDEAMTEEGNSGHYKGSMTVAVAGVYGIVIRIGAAPADGDVAIGQGEIYWDGTAEMNISTLDTLLDAITANLGQVHTTEDESPGGTIGASGTSGIAEGC